MTPGLEEIETGRRREREQERQRKGEERGISLKEGGGSHRIRPNNLIRIFSDFKVLPTLQRVS